jgi:hypothetical protein
MRRGPVEKHGLGAFHVVQIPEERERLAKPLGNTHSTVIGFDDNAAKAEAEFCIDGGWYF